MPINVERTKNGSTLHLDQARDRARRVVRVDRGQHEVAGHRGVNGDFRRFLVADLADHDHVGILPQECAQRAREGEPDLRLHGDLVNAADLVLDGVLGGQDVDVRVG